MRDSIKIPNATGEERRVSNHSISNMAACSIQATLASILQRLRVVEDNQSRGNAAIAKLRLEMEDASSRIQELEFSHESALREINILLQRFGEQMTTSRRKEQEKLRAAFVRLREEIEEERNTCRLLKLENKRLIKELEEANIVAADAGEELDRERQARELMEEVCNELAREIGEDKAEVEQLKQEQAKSREMVEEEMRMMRMASLWRDERVRNKISEAQTELDDKHLMGMPLHDLKSRIEEFVSTVSGEPYKSPRHVDNIDEKKQHIIEQAQMLRCALELSMQDQLAEGGDFLQSEADTIPREERILIPAVTQDQHINPSVNCCSSASSVVSNTVHTRECRDHQSVSHSDFQVKPSNYMLNYSKKPCKDIRRPRVTSGDDHDYHVFPQYARKYLLSHDNDVETQQEIGTGRILMDGDHINALHQSPSPEQLMYDSRKNWLAPEMRKKDQPGSPAVSLCDINEQQINVPSLQRSLSSTHHAPLKGLHRKQLSLHLDASEDADVVWDDHLTPSTHAHSYSEDDACHVYCTDGAGMYARHEPGIGKHMISNTACVYAAKQVDDMHPWKDPLQEDPLQEEMAREDNDMGHHAECLMHREYDDAKSLCAGGAEGDEEGEFDGFYFEPVMGAISIENQCKVHYLRGDCDGHLPTATDDEERICQPPVGSMSSVHIKSSQQSRSPNKSGLHDGNGHTSARYSGTSANSSYREEAPYKLVVPAPTMRVPLVKAQFTSPKSARSVSPSKPQVLQCFRPTPTSPEHNSAMAAPRFNKGHVKGSPAPPSEVIEAQHHSHTSKAAVLLKANSYKSYNLIEQEGAHQTNSKAGEVQKQGDEASPEDKKGNSLRAELLKARELDLEQYVEHVQYNMQKAAAAAPPPPKSSNTSSSFRFSPLRRSLTNKGGGLSKGGQTGELGD